MLNAHYLISDDERFVFFADDFFRSDVSRAKQLVEPYEKTGKSAISLIEVDKANADKYGMVDHLGRADPKQPSDLADRRSLRVVPIADLGDHPHAPSRSSGVYLLDEAPDMTSSPSNKWGSPDIPGRFNVATGRGIAQVWNMCSLPVGRVIVWDRGTYTNESPYDMAKGLKRGHLSFNLNGEKLHGSYTPARIRDGEQETWLLVKKSDEYADAWRNLLRSESQSAVSARTLDELS